MSSSKPIETERLSLRELDQSYSLKRYQEWLEDSTVNQYLETRFKKIEGTQLAEYVHDMGESHHSYLFAIVERESGEHIGNIKLGPINQHHKTAAVGFFIGEKQWWGKGIAREVIVGVSDWAFRELQLAKLTAGSYAENIGSIKALESAGFLREGRQLSQVALVSGQRDDVVIFGKLNPITVGGDSHE